MIRKRLRNISFYQVFIVISRKAFKMSQGTSSGTLRWHSGEVPACQLRRHKWRGFNPWVGKLPWHRKWQLTPVFLPGKFHGQKSLLVAKELDTTEHTWLAQQGVAWRASGSSLPTLCVGLLQARILEWVAGSSQPRDKTPVSRAAYRFFTIWAIGAISRDCLNYMFLVQLMGESDDFQFCFASQLHLYNGFWFFAY